VNPLLGHTNLESTVHCLGIEVEDALDISEQTEIKGHDRLRLVNGPAWSTFSASPDQPFATVGFWPIAVLQQN
jgi:hypothetical protein